MTDETKYRKFGPMSDEAFSLNRRLLGPLAGGVPGEGFEKALIELLRSDHPIAPPIRDALAQALDGSHPSLKVTIARKRSGPVPNLIKGLRTHFAHLSIGARIHQHPFFAEKVDAAVLAIVAEEKEAGRGLTRPKGYKYLALYRAALEEIELESE